MRILDRYLFRELLVPLIYCIGGFLIFWVAFDLLSTLDEFQKLKLKGIEVALYYVLKTPELLSLVLPMALLLALLYAITTHARHNELTAMRAAGISLWRISMPYLITGFFFSIALFVIDEYWMPRSQERVDDLMSKPVAGAEESRFWRQNLFFQNEADHREWQISAYNLKSGEMVSPSVIWKLPDGMRREIYASRANYKDGSWNFFDVQEVVSIPGNPFASRSQTNFLSFHFSETPELIKSEIKITSLRVTQAAKRAQLSMEEIYNYFRLHPQLGRAQSAILHTQLHSRIAWPWTCLVIVMIALPFSAAHGRRNVFVGVAASIFICLIFFILLRVGLTLGTAGHMSPWAAAWLPNILFGATGFVLTMRAR